MRLDFLPNRADGDDATGGGRTIVVLEGTRRKPSANCVQQSEATIAMAANRTLEEGATRLLRLSTFAFTISLLVHNKLPTRSTKVIDFRSCAYYRTCM